MSDEWDAPIEEVSSTTATQEVAASEPVREAPAPTETREQPPPSRGDDVALSEESGDADEEERAGAEQGVVSNMAALKQDREGAAAEMPEGEKPSQAASADKPAGEQSQRLDLKRGQLLARGSSGDEVRQMQQMLNQQMGLNLDVDGKMGPETEAAIRKMQQDRGLRVDGIVGPQTMGSLNAWRADGNHDMHNYNGGDWYKDRAGTSSTGATGGAGQTSGTGPVDPTRGPARPGSGEAAVRLAERYLGMNSIDVRGRMPHFTAAGGQTRNCADFVSSALESQGLVRGHHINVREFERSLQSQGYERVPFSQARPGDVWISSNRGHTELVATPGATRLIGSNNDRPGHQVISYHDNPRSGYIYQLRR